MMIRIYLTNLGKYNEGILLGEWVDLPVSHDELMKVFDRIKICHDKVDYSDKYGNPYEEWFITDYETDVDGIKIGEYDSLDNLNKLAETLEDLNDNDREIVEALLSEGYSLDDAIDKEDDCIVYSDCNDMEDVARQYIEETGLLNSVPENLRDYFDFEAYGRDMSFEGQYVFTKEGNCVQIL